MSSALIQSLIALAREAGQAILAFYHNESDKVQVRSKADDSPVTQADLASNAILHKGLRALTPDIPILSEEADIPSFEIRRRWQQYWCVDPLDGTKEFIARTDEFCICIAKMSAHSPTMGLIYSPLDDTAFFASQGEGAHRQVGDAQPEKIHTRRLNRHKPIVVTMSRRHRGPRTEILVNSLGKTEIVRLGSALKFTKIACGEMDFYPGGGKTKAWDTAAGQILLEEAGGQVLSREFQALSYNHRPSLENPPFLAIGDPKFDWQSTLELP